MGIGLPKLELVFKAAAVTAASRSKQGVAAVIVLEAQAAAATVTSYARASELPASLGGANLAYVQRTFTGSDLGGPSKVLVCQAPAGTDEEGRAAGLAAALAALEASNIDYLAGPPDLTAAEAETIKDWVQTRRTARGTVKAVLPYCGADDMGVINYAPCPEGMEISVGQDHYTAAEYCSRIAGILAGIPSACSSTGAVLEEITAVPAYEDPDSEVDAGKLILIHDGTSAQIARGVNSMVTVPVDGAEEWKKIKIVENMDLITYYLRTTINTQYKGKYANSYDNKILLISAILDFFDVLETQMVCEPGSSWVEIDLEEQTKWLRAQGLDVDTMTEQEILEHKTADWVFLVFGSTLLDAMEDFALVGKMS